MRQEEETKKAGTQTLLDAEEREKVQQVRLVKLLEAPSQAGRLGRTAMEALKGERLPGKGLAVGVPAVRGGSYGDLAQHEAGVQEVESYGGGGGGKR